MSAEARSTRPAPDPYAEQPTLWQTHPLQVQVVAVAVATILLAVASFPPFEAPEFAYAMLVPGIFWAYHRPRFKVFAWTMLGAQAVAWIIILGWLHHVTWVGLLLLGSFTGAWVGLWYLAAWWAMPRFLGRSTPVRLAAMLGLCGAWVLVEWTRTWFLTGFPWLPLAASQWQRPSILQVASYTGAWGVSFVLVAVNIGFAAYAHRLFREGLSGFKRRSQEFFLALFLLIGCLNLHLLATYNRGAYVEPLARVAFVQPAIPQTLKWDEAAGPGILRVLENFTLLGSMDRAELILLPEAVTPWAVRGDPNTQAWVEALARRVGAPLLMGSIAEDPSPGNPMLMRNGAFLVDPKEGVQPAYYAKRQLVPFGEYVPLRPILGWLDKVVPLGGDFQPGGDPSPMLVTAGSRVLLVGPLICFEDTYPGLARASVGYGARVLVVLTNDGWFGEGGMAYQHAAHSVLRAVETRRPVLRAGNAGWSGWIDEFGRVRSVAQDPDGSVYFRGTRTVNITHDREWAERETFYVRHGDWFVLVSLGLAAFGGLMLRVGTTGEPKPGRRRYGRPEPEPSTES